MLEQFDRIFIGDTEYQKPDGEPTHPVCSVIIELRSGTVYEDFFDQRRPCPITFTDKDLFVAYSAHAELGTFLAAGWPLPENILDLYLVHLREMNGARDAGLIKDFVLKSQPAKLITALLLIGRPDLIYADKEGMREYIISNGVTPPPGVSLEAHRRKILDYCMTDVVSTVALLAGFEKVLTEGNHLDQALVYSKFAVPVAYFEENGTPMNAPLVDAIRRHRKDLVLHLVTSLEQKYRYGIFDKNGVRKAAGFNAMVAQRGLADIWPITEAGNYKTDKETMTQMSQTDRELEPLKELLKYLPQLRSSKLKCGSDGRSRPSVWPCKLKSGRCSPGGDCVLGQPKGMRRLMRAEPGYAIVDVDASQEEYGLAGALSGDRVMKRVYASGKCIYLALAQENGAIPRDGTKASHPEERALWKTVQLAGQYGIAGVALSRRLKLNSPMKAEEMLGKFRETYSEYFDWADRQIAEAYKNGQISSPLGWRQWVSSATRRNSLLNFPVQSAGADVLRVACILAVSRGLGPYLCYPHHDAVYCHCPIPIAERVGQILAECFRDAGKIVTGDERFELRCGKPDIFPYPQYYLPGEPDKETGKYSGWDLWEIVVNFIKEKEPELDLCLPETQL